VHDLTINDPEDKRIRFRAGINIGDVIVETHDIFGDDVNIAARLEGIAEPGGICVSSSVYGHVRGKVGVEFADLGGQNLKNIADPVRIYAVVPEAQLFMMQANGSASFQRLIFPSSCCHSPALAVSQNKSISSMA
jgi:class 3 adenylate cyclase